VLQTPLDDTETPGARAVLEGAVHRRHAAFLDPAVLAPGRRVTVAGQIAGGKRIPIEKVDYAYPVLTIKQIYLCAGKCTSIINGRFLLRR